MKKTKLISVIISAAMLLSVSTMMASAAEGNLAQGKPATAKVVDLVAGYDEDAELKNGDDAKYKASVEGDTYSIDKALDGDMSTSWAAPWARCGSEIVIDLEAVCNVKEVKLSFPETATAKHQVAVSVSTDNATWTEFAPTVYDVSSNPETGEFSFTNAGVDAQYVKIYLAFAEAGQEIGGVTYAEGTEFPKIPEIEVYGEGGTVTPPATDDDNNDDNTDDAPATDETPNVPNTDTGVEGFAFAVLAIVVLAGAAVVVSRKRSSVR